MVDAQLKEPRWLVLADAAESLINKSEEQTIVRVQCKDGHHTLLAALIQYQYH